MPAPLPSPYRGRIAPTPSGLLHRGHARTFWLAWRRARSARGSLFMRIDDLDGPRCRPEFTTAAIDDLAWLGLDWDDFPDRDAPNPAAPFAAPAPTPDKPLPVVYQSKRLELYRAAFERLREAGFLYPSPHSRREVQTALSAPHEGDHEPVFPPCLRQPISRGPAGPDAFLINWRFLVPDGRTLIWEDAAAGPQAFTAGTDFGDFLVWRRDGFPSYELSCAVDDILFGITEIVRGGDLLLSTARQRLIQEALGHTPPRTCHVPLVRDSAGRRLAKRTGGESLADLRAAGITPAALHAEFARDLAHLLPDA